MKEGTIKEANDRHDCKVEAEKKMEEGMDAWSRMTGWVKGGGR